MGVQSHCSKRRVSRAYSLTQLNRQKHRGVSCVNGDIDSYQLSLTYVAGYPWGQLLTQTRQCPGQILTIDAEDVCPCAKSASNYI